MVSRGNMTTQMGSLNQSLQALYGLRDCRDGCTLHIVWGAKPQNG